MIPLPKDDHFINVYLNKAAAYHELIAAEDADGNLLPALQAVASLAGARIADLGSGSGRIPLLLQAIDCELLAVDVHRPMLVEQAQQAAAIGRAWPLAQADGRRLPLPANWAEVSTAGWAYGHFTGWAQDWKPEVQAALAEMERITRPGGTLVIFETLGTGVEQAAPPNPALASYYAWLEAEQGFQRQEIATDYDFGSVDRAAEICGFFFGDEMAARVHANRWSRVPEWTGMWSRPAGR